MSNPNARDRRTVERIRYLDTTASFLLRDLPELETGARLYLDTHYDETQAYLAWEELESGAEAAGAGSPKAHARRVGCLGSRCQE